MSSRASTSFVDRYIGRRIAEERKKQGVKQQSLAEAARVTRETVAQIETGGQNITLSTLLRIASALEVPPASLLPSTDQGNYDD